MKESGKTDSFFVCYDVTGIEVNNMLRNDRVNNVMNRLSCDQLLVSDPLSIYYLCEKMIHPGERFLGLLLRRNSTPVLYVNELFRFEEEIGCEKKYYSDIDDVAQVVGMDTDHNAVLGVDKILPARFLLPFMEQGIASAFINGSLAVDHTRAVKEDVEIELMRESSRINDAAMEQFKGLIHEGVSEKEVAAKVMDIYRSFGAEDLSFPAIVAFGVNAADPHHMPDDTVVKEGDAVLFDVGCVYHGYCSDMTRTFFYKKGPDKEQERIYNLVRNACESAESYVQPGRRLCDIDSVARDIITEGGYGPDFTHRLGHFIGQEDHEFGDVSQGFKDEVVPGNIFSIEPGIYHPAILGCRIEDLILVTENGHEVLNHYPREIEIIG